MHLHVCACTAKSRSAWVYIWASMWGCVCMHRYYVHVPEGNCEIAHLQVHLCKYVGICQSFEPVNMHVKLGICFCMQHVVIALQNPIKRWLILQLFVCSIWWPWQISCQNVIISSRYVTAINQIRTHLFVYWYKCYLAISSISSHNCYSCKVQQQLTFDVFMYHN